MGSIGEDQTTCNGRAEDHDGLNVAEKVLRAVSDARMHTKDLFSTTDSDNAPTIDDPRALHAGIFGDLASQTDRIPEDISMLLEGADAAKSGGLVGDKKMLMEKIIQLAASLPSDSPLLQTLNGNLIGNLWEGIPHPPTSYVGDEWQYRTADGSNNSKAMPWLGKAGSTYARSVEPKTSQSPTPPDAGLVFDELLARGSEARVHPNQVSSLLFYLATIIVHDIFRTSDVDWTKADNSSYLDLSPLYGNSDASQRNVRTLQDGKLKPDTFAEARLLAFPPGVAALLCAFNRFHNYVAEQLAEINERQRFSLIPPERWTATLKKEYGTPEAKRDHDLFNTARLVTCGLYVNIILHDYVRTILNLNSTNSSWTLDPRQQDDQIAEAGGNQVSVEFNLVYRWHSAISVKDEKWTEEFLKGQLGDDKDVRSLGVDDFLQASRKFGHQFKHRDPGTWPLGNLKSEKDGSFKTKELVELLTQATEDCAASFGARNVPVALRAIEILGIEQSRKWNVCTLNEFRQFFGMQPHRTFADITSQPDVAASLETLYGSPDNVELYPGLMVEDGKPVMQPGSGLCPGYTISKAILSDATALVRGDRFYTQDYNPANLTNWGYHISQSDPNIAGGGVMYKLLYRAFPQHYVASSAYAMFPFQTPAKTKENLQHLGQLQDFDFQRPGPLPQPKLIDSWEECTEILSDHEKFKVPWSDKIKDITLGRDYCHAGDTDWHRKQHEFIDKAIYCPHSWKQEISTLYEQLTLDLVDANSRKLRNGFQIDIVKDIAISSHTRAMARIFHIPLKKTGAKRPAGFLSEHEFYTHMSSIFRYIFANSDSCNGYALRQEALRAAAVIRPLTERVVDSVKHGNFHELAHDIFQATGQRTTSDDLAHSFGTQLIRRLLQPPKPDSNTKPYDVPTILTLTIAEGLCAGSQSLTQILDLLHTAPHDSIWPKIPSLSPTETDSLILESLRLSPPVYALPRLSTNPANPTNTPVILNLLSASLSPTNFANPQEINLSRPRDRYLHHGWGAHACIGRELITTALAAQIRVLANLSNLRRMPGAQGKVKFLWKEKALGWKVFLSEDWRELWPFATTMGFLYDA